MSERIISQRFEGVTVRLQDYAGCRFVDSEFVNCRIEGPGTIDATPPPPGVVFGYYKADDPVILFRGNNHFERCTFDGVCFDPATWEAIRHQQGLR